MKKLVSIVLALALVLLTIGVVFADGTNGTITLTNAAIGKDYQAYKILDATYNGDAISYTTANRTLFNGEGSPWSVSTEADANGNYNVAIANGKTVADISAWITDHLTSFTALNPSTGASGATATADELTWTGLANGYYYITSTLGTTVTIDTVANAATVVDKNTTQPNDLEKENNSPTAQIGDEVQFTVTFNATNYITTNTTDANGKVTATTNQVHLYTVTDTANGFDYLVDATHPVTVTVGNNDAFTVASPTITQQTASASGSMVFTLDWDDENSGNTGNPIYDYEESVTITYTGRVNEFAFDGDARNDVVLSQDATNDTLTDYTTSVNYNLTINKTDGTDALTGAKFELYRNSDSSPMTLVDITSTITSPADATLYFRAAEAGESGVTTINMTKDTYSSAIIYGLDGADTYKIKETEAPQGYNKLEGTTDHAMNNANGSETIANTQGTVLPSTGGIGTTIFYVLGGILVIGAAVILVARRKAHD